MFNIKKFKKYKKAFIISICVLFVLSVIATTIVSGNIYHLETCTVDHCSTCDLIHTAINFISSIFYLFIWFYLLGIVIPLLKLKKEKDNFITTTLVECKVQKNE